MVRRRHRLPPGITGASVAVFSILAAAGVIIGGGALLLPAAPAVAQWAYRQYRHPEPALPSYSNGSDIFAAFRLQPEEIGRSCDGCGR
jgi:hypothetical protein